MLRQEVLFVCKLRTLCVMAVSSALVAGIVYAQGRGAPATGTQTAAGPIPALLRNYASVTTERLTRPEDANWLSVRGTYDGWGYSPLTQITPANVKNLKPVWTIATGENSAMEAPVLVNNGVMFAALPQGQVMALEAKTGRILWRYRRARPAGLGSPGHNRGVALYGDKVFVAASDATLLALDAKTGKQVWSTTVADYKTGYNFSLAPLVAGGKVMVGTGGGEYGIRGFISAYDPDTGKELWKTYTIPAPGEPGSETWPNGDQWKTGGGSLWVTGNYDPATNTAYWGVGNPGPWIGDKRPGDNLYTDSTLAIDVNTGKIKGYFQYHQNDSWDWDEVSPPILVDFQRGGRTFKGLVDAARDGYLWFLDRGDANNARIKFVEGKPFVFQNVFKSLDPETGRPEVDPAHKPGTGKKADFCPGASGGKNFPPVAFSPKTRLIYIPANNNLCGSGMGEEIVEYVPGKTFIGNRGGGGPPAVAGADHIGEVQAWNVDTGKEVWHYDSARSVNWGGLLSTASGLVFGGGTADRKLHAYDAATGKVLWESLPTNSGIESPPVAFMVDGKEYIAVETGFGEIAAGNQNTVNRLFPGEGMEVPEGGALWVFAVE